MRLRPIVYPYNMGSRSARALARGLGTRRVYPDRKYRPYSNHVVVNWGNSSWPDWHWGCVRLWLNHPEAVGVASNKLTSFAMFRAHGVSTPRWTTDAEWAYEWETGVMVRGLLRGSGGRGCQYVMAENRDLLLNLLGNAPLYVEYIKKEAEYRIHVFKDKVIDCQQKKLRRNSTGNDFQIRSYDNGWVFCRDNINLPSSALSLAISAVEALGLDFGAVDIIYNSHYDTYYVLEVNTAPGLVGQTLTSYIEAIKGYIYDD